MKGTNVPLTVSVENGANVASTENLPITLQLLQLTTTSGQFGLVAVTTSVSLTFPVSTGIFEILLKAIFLFFSLKK